MRALVWTLGLVCMLMTLSGSVYAADNVFTNGDAEQGKIGEKPPAWRSEGNDGTQGNNDFPLATVSGGQSGDKAIKLERPAGWKGWSWTYIEQVGPFTMDRYAKCEFTVWLKADKEIKKRVDLTLIPKGVTHLFRPLRERVNVGTAWQEYRVGMDLFPTRDENGKPAKVDMRAIIQLYSGVPLYIDDASLVFREPTAEELAKMKTLEAVLAAHPTKYPCPIGTYGGIVVMDDGRLLGFDGGFTSHESTDGGKTWERLGKLDLDGQTSRLNGAIRMKDGTIGVYTESPVYFWKSADNGKTWSKRITIGPKGAPLAGDTMVQLSSGRLIVPVREMHTVPSRLRDQTGVRGTFDGEPVRVGIHGHPMEMIISWCYYSDDQGETWKRSKGDIIIWKDDGYGGMWPCDEPNLVELRDGRLMMFIRTTLGRVYKAYSPDQGETWDYPEPTPLPASISTARIKRVPENEYTKKGGRAGDLICAWNNVSPEETRSGCHRGRLSAAVSRDDGKTWEHVRTFDTTCLPPIDRLADTEPPRMTRGGTDVGELPYPYGYVSMPDMAFVGDKVILRYRKSFRHPKVSLQGYQILPLDWFYGKE